MTRLRVPIGRGSRGLLVLFTLFSVAIAHSWAVALTIEDTYTRADNTALGVTEVGGYGYLEVGTTSSVIDNDVAAIVSEELAVYGIDGASSSAPGLAVIDANLADLTMSADMRFTFPNGQVNTSTYNVSGFILRRNQIAAGFGAANEGQVEVVMHVGGGLFIREVAGGALQPALYSANPFGLGGSADNNYSLAGQLPTTWNGQPFDANGNGILEDNEPFNFSASLVGNALSVAVNGLEVANVMTSASAPAPANFFSTPALYKNRWTSGGTRDITSPVFDNLVINGTEYIPPPPPPILHVGDANPLNEAWVAQNSGTVANNGPVDDGGTPAWNIEDASSARAAWTRVLSPGQVQIAQNQGWRMEATVKVLGLNDAPDGAIELSVFPNSNLGYLIWLGSDDFGRTLVSEFGGPAGSLALGRTAEITGLGYHDYEIVYNGVHDTANLYVDGSLVLEDLVTANLGATVLNRVLWGSNAGGGLGNANYTHVEFTLVPEPATLLSTTLCLGLFLYARRRSM